MSVTMLSILLALSSLGAMASSVLQHVGGWTDDFQRWQGPELAGDGEAPDEGAPQGDAAEVKFNSVLRSLRRIGAQPVSRLASPPPQEREVFAPRPLPVAPALQPSLPVPAPIWPSVRFLSRATSKTADDSSTAAPGTTGADCPRLTLACQAPQAVDLGSQVRYRLVIRNTGAGVAEQVVVEPQILSGGNRLSTKRFPVGDLLPGESRDITLRDLARNTQSLHVHFFATDRNGSEAAAAARIQVRRPAVQISLDGPGRISLGDQAVLEIRAANTGAGAAEPVRVLCSVGDGLRLTPLDQQVQFATRQGQMTWAIGRLAAGESKVLRLKARPATAGEHSIRVAIESESDQVGRLPRPVVAEKTITVRDRAADERTARCRASQVYAAHG